MTTLQNGFSRYLPVNEEALRWEIYCNDAGYSHVRPGASYPIHPEQHPLSYAATVATGRVLREYQVVYITAGSGWFTDTIHGTRDVRAGDIFILFPGVMHAYSPHIETGWQEYWVGFSGKHADRLHRNGLFDAEKPIHHPGINQEIMSDFEQIILLCREQTPAFQIRLGALILQLLAHIHATEMTSQTAGGDSDLVNTARSLMHLHLESGVEVEQLAEEIGVSYTRLLDIFRKYTGLTPYQYFLQLRIHRAKELLLHEETSVKEVAARLNFENQYYFSRLFKKKTGYTPSRWKEGV